MQDVWCYPLMQMFRASCCNLLILRSDFKGSPPIPLLRNFSGVPGWHAKTGSVASRDVREPHGRMIFPYPTKQSNAWSPSKVGTLLSQSSFSVSVGTVHIHSAIETLKRWWLNVVSRLIKVHWTDGLLTRRWSWKNPSIKGKNDQVIVAGWTRRL